MPDEPTWTDANVKAEEEAFDSWPERCRYRGVTKSRRNTPTPT